MKEFVLIAVFLFSVVKGFAQKSAYDFTMRLQKSVVHDVMIFPNPIETPQFKIRTNSNIDKIEIFDLVGKMVFSQEIEFFSSIYTINLPEIKKGVYVVKIIFDDSSEIILKLFYK